jgi:hypothetical protein
VRRMGYWLFFHSDEELLEWVKRELEKSYEEDYWWTYRYNELLRVTEKFIEENRILQLPVLGFIIMVRPEYNNVFIKVMMANDRFHLSKEQEEPDITLVDLEEMFDP